MKSETAGWKNMKFERILGCDNDIMELKSRVKEYPAALKTAIIWRDVYFAQFRH